jgi:hypothetical protein
LGWNGKISHEKFYYIFGDGLKSFNHDHVNTPSWKPFVAYDWLFGVLTSKKQVGEGSLKYELSLFGHIII